MLIVNEIDFLLAHGFLFSNDIFSIQNTDISSNKPLKFLYCLNSFCGPLLKTMYNASFKMLKHL